MQFFSSLYCIGIKFDCGTATMLLGGKTKFPRDLLHNNVRIVNKTGVHISKLMKKFSSDVFLFCCHNKK